MAEWKKCHRGDKELYVNLDQLLYLERTDPSTRIYFVNGKELHVDEEPRQLLAPASKSKR
jgi:hypothetical protein